MRDALGNTPKVTRPTRPISHDEAAAVAQRLIAGAFRREDRAELVPRFSIPANPDRDDDLLILAYIRQQASRTVEVVQISSAPRPLLARVASRLGISRQRFGGRPPAA